MFLMVFKISSASIQSRFNLAISISIGGLAFLSFLGFGISQVKTLRSERNQMIESQVLHILSTHSYERRTFQYIPIQRLLKTISNVDATALLDRSCKLLTPSLIFDEKNINCKNPRQGEILVKYPDVLSPIGYAIVRTNLPNLNWTDVTYWFAVVGILSFLIFITLQMVWKRFLYGPLVDEISTLISSSSSATFVELSPVSSFVKKLVDENQAVIMKKLTLEQEEKKYQTALKVAHDILAPLKLLKNITLDPRSASALDQIEKTAWDLLPEKAPMQSVRCDLAIILTQVVDTLKIDFPRHTIEMLVSSCTPVAVSKVHFARAFQNLLKNALEVQPIETALIIRSVPGSTLRLEIVDAGPGFEPVWDSKTSKAQGSGLGLQSARAALELMSIDLEFEKGTSGGTITRLKIPQRSLEIFYGPAQKIKTFGCQLQGCQEIFNLTEASSTDVIISPFACPKDSFEATWKVVSTSDLRNVRLTCLKGATLVEDDKYVQMNWLSAAKRAGIELQMVSSQVVNLSHDVVFMDRFLGDFDTSEWGGQLKQQGKSVVSISATSEYGKNPPWI